jgi:predicted nucleotidyltransferase
MSVRSVGRAAGLSHTAAGSTLRDLDAMGLVSRTSVGRAIVYELRRSNAYVRHMVLPAIRAEQAILTELCDELVVAFADESETLILFGSYSTGDQDEASDIDVFVLARDERRKQLLEQRAAERLAHFSATYGSPLSLLAYTRADAQRHLSGGQNPFRTELESTGIILHGLGVSEWGIDESEEANGSCAEAPRPPTAHEG